MGQRASPTASFIKPIVVSDKLTPQRALLQAALRLAPQTPRAEWCSPCSLTAKSK